jgi:hypothetical protein
VYLFGTTQYADWAYGFFAITALLKLSEIDRNDQLKLIFNISEYRYIRLLENGLLLFPFILFLMFYGYYMATVLLLVSGVFFAVFGKFKSRSFVIYTPFKKIPFEFIIGFRRAYGVILVAYFLIFKSIEVGNFNLGLFSLGVVFLVSMSFYLNPENVYFVWIFSEKSERFLMRKVLVGFIGSSVLSVFGLVTLYIAFPENLLMILMIQSFGYVLLFTVILAKYSAYPNEVSLSHVVLLGMSLWFPPMLLGVVPFFYMQSKRKLDLILHDKNNTTQ